jgi:hypothetical protein
MAASGIDSATGAVPVAATMPPRRRLRFSLDPRGQSLVEFAISFPVVLLMILFGVDFGRVFMGWVQLTAAVREAANFAAINPNAWTDANAAAQAEYARLITTEAADSNCTLPDSLPAPTFPSGYDVGSPLVVSITCHFALITPVISNLLGSSVAVSASASFPIRSGHLDGTGFSGVGLPSFAPTPTVDTGGGGGTGGGGPGESIDPGFTPIPTPSGIPTPVPTCTVPDLWLVNSSQATNRWTAAGFSANNLIYDPLVPPNYKIKRQSIDAGATVPCTSTMTVNPTVAP